jgi:Protein of unknown function (DUF3892)
MEKWADYCISNVRYNSSKTHIEEFKVRQDLGDSFGVPKIWGRDDVLDTLRNNESFCTIMEGTDNKWYKGAKVEIITINDIDYIKTVKDSITKDNLGDLPPF